MLYILREINYYGRKAKGRHSWILVCDKLWKCDHILCTLTIEFSNLYHY